MKVKFRKLCPFHVGNVLLYIILSLPLNGFSLALLEAQDLALEPHRDLPPKKVDSSLPIQSSYAVKVDVDSVFLNVSVRDRITNRSLGSLQKSDFQVYEDGIHQDIYQFLPVEAPFNMLLLLDTSGSTGSYLKMMKQAAIEFTHEINDDDHIAVATFNTKVRLAQDFTSDRDAAERAIKRIKSGGGTAFYDALMTSIDKYMAGIQGRNAIVIFTDGLDNQLEGNRESGSRIDFDDLFRRVQEIDTIVYTIFLNTEELSPNFAGGSGGTYGVPGWPGRRRVGFARPFPFPFPPLIPIPPRKHDYEDSLYRKAKEQLTLIADQTGGRIYTPTKIAELSGAYSEIADDLRIQYQLGYNSSNRVHDGKWRTIRVELNGRPDAVIRTRPGYFAGKDPGI